VQPYVDSGRLVACATTLPPRQARTGYAWRLGAANPHPAPPGRALAWWLQQLADERTRAALLRCRPNAMLW
ncbi:hypothetical protein, partial [Acinetobacter baumannii]